MASSSTALIERTRSTARWLRRAGPGGDGGRPPSRGEPRAVERLAHIDVAEPGDHPLIGKRGLQAGLLAVASAREHRRIERVAERLGTERPQQRFLLQCRARHELHRAETPGVVEGDDRAVRHVEHDVVVGKMLRTRVVKPAGHSADPVPQHAERARHAEMHQQHVAGGEIGEQVFGAPAEPLDGLAFEPRLEIFRQRPAQIAAARFDFREARTFHDRRKAAAHGLDFGQFRHDRSYPDTAAPDRLHEQSATAAGGRHSAPRGGALWFCRERTIRDARHRRKTPISASGRSRSAPSRRWSTTSFAAWRDRYDLMNDLMSGGLHRVWKDALVTAVDPPKGERAFRAARCRRRHRRHRIPNGCSAAAPARARP